MITLCRHLEWQAVLAKVENVKKCSGSLSKFNGFVIAVCSRDSEKK